MIKLIQPMRRKPGMSVEAFREYYENHHRLIGEKYLDGFACRYLRRYLSPTRDREGHIVEPDYDVILEIWFPDMETLKASGKRLAEPDVAAEIRADEAKLFDLTSMHSYLLEEHESEMSQPGA